MRLRLERELGSANPLKAGRGGYYDIDFSLMYLRLRGAGIFYKVLNTPERIDVIEKMGHLDREDADFLREGIESIAADEIQLRLISPLRPAVIEGGEDDPTYLIMPIRLPG